MRIAGCILAGGRSSRFGTDKGLAMLHSKSLLEHVIDRLRLQVDRIIINTNSTAKEYLRAGLPIVADQNQDFDGPLAGVLAGLGWAGINGVDGLVTVAVDTPMFPLDLIAQFTSRENSSIVVAASRSGLHPTFALWPVSVAPALASWLTSSNNRKMMDFLTTQSCIKVTFDASQALDPFFNVNMPEDLRIVSDHGVDRLIQ